MLDADNILIARHALKRWVYRAPQQRLSKRKKDELDLIRLAEAHPELKANYPSDVRDQIDGR
jgi:hypothetical protein